jgi:hypothetical protein
MATQGDRNMLEVYNDSTVINSQIFTCNFWFHFHSQSNIMFQGQDWGLDRIFRRKIRLIPIQFDPTGKAQGYSCSQSLGPYLVLAEMTWVAQRLRTALPKIPNWAGVSLRFNLKIRANSVSVFFVTTDNEHNARSKWSQMWYTKIRIVQNCTWLFVCFGILKRQRARTQLTYQAN